MMKAEVGSRENVTGRSSATVKAGPMPGSTPTAVPSVTPASAHARWGSVIAFAKPSASAARISDIRYYLPTTNHQLPTSKYPARKLQIEHAAEEQVRANGDRQGKQRVAQWMARIEGARDKPEQRRRCDNESRALCQYEIEQNAG